MVYIMHVAVEIRPLQDVHKVFSSINVSRRSVYFPRNKGRVLFRTLEFTIPVTSMLRIHNTTNVYKSGS